METIPKPIPTYLCGFILSGNISLPLSETRNYTLFDIPNLSNMSGMDQSSSFKTKRQTMKKKEHSTNQTLLLYVLPWYTFSFKSANKGHFFSCPYSAMISSCFKEVNPCVQLNQSKRKIKHTRQNSHTQFQF